MNEVIKDVTNSPLTLGTAVASFAALAYIVVKGIYHGSEGNRNRVHPPGPPQDLLIGNLRQFPKNKFADTFHEWAKQYGSCPSISITTAYCWWIYLTWIRTSRLCEIAWNIHGNPEFV
jgi:hypothetical protein